MYKHFLSKNTFLVGVLLLGALFTAYRAHGSIPYHPMDLVSYLGGYYAARDGGNPYDLQQAAQSLEQRGVSTAPLNFLYSPPFLLGMLPLEVVSYRFYRLAWIAASVLSAWLSVFLLSRGTKRLMPLFIAGAFVFLTVSEPLNDNLVCGQIMSFMLLALSLMVIRKFRGVAVGVAATLFPITKVGFLPLAFFIRGKRASIAFVLSLAGLCLATLFLAGSHVFVEYEQNMRQLESSLSLTGSNNFAITHATMLFVKTTLVRGDRVRAANDFEYKFDLARRQGDVLKAVYLVLSALTASVVLLRLFGNRRKGMRYSREDILSIALLYLMVFVPCVWIHYGVFFLLPLRTLVLRRRSLSAVLFIASTMLWGIPFSLAPSWPRFLIPLAWLFFMAFIRDSDDLHRPHLINK